MSRDIPFENYAEYLDTFEYLYREKMIGKRHLNKARGNAYYKMGKLHASKGDWPAALQKYRTSLKYSPLRPQPWRGIWEAWRRRQLPASKPRS
jgi:hypothetical protein